MGIYQIGKKWYIDLTVDGRRKRKAIGSRKEAENALMAIKADVLRVDFENQFLLLRDTKSNRPRKVPMSGLVAETLRTLKKEKEYLLFANPKTGKPLSDLQTPFKAACKRAGIRDLRFHDLRHTAATYMVMGGVDLVTVKEILGHATIQMTMRYAHPTPENKRKATEVLANLFDNSGVKHPGVQSDRLTQDSPDPLPPN
jgi:integrase